MHPAAIEIITDPSAPQTRAAQETPPIMTYQNALDTFTSICSTYVETLEAADQTHVAYVKALREQPLTREIASEMNKSQGAVMAIRDATRQVLRSRQLEVRGAVDTILSAGGQDMLETLVLQLDARAVAAGGREISALFDDIFG